MSEAGATEKGADICVVGLLPYIPVGFRAGKVTAWVELKE
ncbi:hypothetical protein SS05631_c13230 [Sinorhizobium sp. CCBAU 05631]|nr:hypothetical protein SS05631_c13230 [Sinorhizobium sp. CCBAU 05631]